MLQTISSRDDMPPNEMEVVTNDLPDKQINRSRLIRALVSTCEDASNIPNEAFTCCQQLDGEVLHSIHLDGFGDLKLPIKLEDVERLVALGEPAPYGKGLNTSVDPTKKKAQQIDGSLIWRATPEHFISNTLADMSLSTLQSLNLDWLLENSTPNIVELHLHKLFVYEAGGHYKRQCELDLEQGMCAVIILQIPVENGYTGGRVKVECRSVSRLYDMEKDSDKGLFLTAFLSCCDHEMEAIKTGWKVELVIHVVWKNDVAVSKIPLPLPHVLDLLTEVRKSLEPWFTNTHHNSVEKRLELRFSGDSRNRKAVYYFQSSDLYCNNPIREKFDNNQPSDRPSLSEIEHINQDGPHMLAFLLGDTYNSTELSFFGLKGRDALAARLLSCATFLDVHLAIMKRDASDSASTEHWINANNILVPFKGITVKIGSQLVQDLANTTTQSQSSLNQAILVIWPRYQSFQMKCRYAFDSLLDEVESLLLKPHAYQPPIVEKSLGRILSFCRLEPVIVFGDSETTLPGERTGRLLQLCVSLNAKQEGLDLLELIGICYSDPVKGEISVEGIRSYRVAELIAEFECRVSGWNACSILILKSLTPLRLPNQLKFIIALVRHLMSRCCVEGAMKIVDRLTRMLPKVDSISRIDQEGIDSFVNLVLDWEADPKTADSQRVTTLAQLFPRLDSYQQCRLIVDLRRRIRFSGIHSCTVLYQDMCRAVPACDLHAPGAIHTILPQVLSCLFYIGDPELIQQMTVKICLKPSIQHPENHLVDVLLSSAEFWELTSSDLGKSMMAALIEAQVTSLSAMLEGNAFDPEPKILLLRNLSELELRLSKQREAIGHVRHILAGSWIDVFCRLANRDTTADPDSTDPFQLALTSFLKTFMQTEKASPDLDGQVQVSCDLLFSAMPLKRLWWLMVALYPPESACQTDWKAIPSCLRIYQELYRRLIDGDFISLIESSKRMLFKLTKCLFWLGDEVALKVFVQKILNRTPVEEENLLVNMMVANTGIWPLAASSCHGLDAFYSLLDRRIDYLKTVVKPVFTLEMPRAQLPIYPEVEQFLRSSEVNMSYKNLASIFHARSFADELTKTCRANGWGSVKAEAKGSARAAWCEISKTRDFYRAQRANYKKVQQELDEMTALRQDFESIALVRMETKETNDCNADSDCVVCPHSPAKHLPEIIDITD